MKRISKFLCVLVCFFILPSYINYSEAEKEKIISLIVPCPVIAEVNQTTPIYNSYDETSGRIGVYEQGAKVEIIQDRSAKWYRVKVLGSESTAWVKREALDIPDDEQPNHNLMTKEELEAYMNIMGFESETNFFILTDIGRQLTYVFKGSKENWELEKTLACSTGKNESPTTRGFFKVGERGEWFYSERLSSGSMYWVRFNGSYLFHSVAMDKNKKIIDNVIGDRRSMGCIRLELADARWIYTNVPERTSVYIT